MDKHYDDNHAPVRSRILLVSGMYSFDFDVCTHFHSPHSVLRIARDAAQSNILHKFIT